KAPTAGRGPGRPGAAGRTRPGSPRANRGGGASGTPPPARGGGERGGGAGARRAPGRVRTSGAPDGETAGGATRAPAGPMSIPHPATRDGRRPKSGTDGAAPPGGEGVLGDV